MKVIALSIKDQEWVGIQPDDAIRCIGEAISSTDEFYLDDIQVMELEDGEIVKELWIYFDSAGVFLTYSLGGSAIEEGKRGYVVAFDGGGLDWRISSKFFISKERAFQAIEHFIKTTERDPRLKWEKSDKTCDF